LRRGDRDDELVADELIADRDRAAAANPPAGVRDEREAPATRLRPPPSRCDTRHLGSGAVDLYWLPLGAGGHFVRLNGRVYEAIAARLERRPAFDLYHSALQVVVSDGTYVIEQTPVPALSGSERGVVAGGAVGARWAGRLRIFRYEIRLWLGGNIPDVAEAVDSPRRLSADEDCARQVLELVPQVPTPVWGRDELGAGEMWNSNSVIAWVIARSGLDTASIQPPAGGRAPGWNAGLEAARRE
jgi:hypothetical protein